MDSASVSSTERGGPASSMPPKPSLPLDSNNASTIESASRREPEAPTASPLSGYDKSLYLPTQTCTFPAHPNLDMHNRRKSSMFPNITNRIPAQFLARNPAATHDKPARITREHRRSNLSQTHSITPTPTIALCSSNEQAAAEPIRPRQHISLKTLPRSRRTRAGLSASSEALVYPNLNIRTDSATC